MRLDPAQQQYRHFLGTADPVAGNYETAAAILKERVAITPTTDLSRALLASALGHLGRAEEACQIWRELKEINPRYSYSDHFGRLPFRNPAGCGSTHPRPAQGGPSGVSRRGLNRMSAHGPEPKSGDVRFSNRPFGVKHFSNRPFGVKHFQTMLRFSFWLEAVTRTSYSPSA